MELDLVCDKCGKTLEVEIITSKGYGKQDASVHVKPCAFCLKEKYDEGDSDGYDRGREDGYQEGQKEAEERLL